MSMMCVDKVSKHTKNMRVDPVKMMFLGFDSKARAIEVITDTGADGQVYVIHADLITKQNEKLLEEVKS